MAKGKLLGFLGKVGSLVGNVIPGAGVAGNLASNAAKMIRAKGEEKAVLKKQVEKDKEIVRGVLGGQSVTGSKVRVKLMDAWEFVKKYWWAFLPAALVGIYLIFFKTKRATRRSRPRTNRSYTPVRRKRSATPKGSAWARKMLLARRRKARKK